MKLLSLLIAVIAASISVFTSNAQEIVTSSTVTDEIVITPKRMPVTSESTRASDEINFTYASTENNQIVTARLNDVTPGKTKVYQAFEMESSDIKKYAGYQVTGFTVISPYNETTKTNSISTGEFFYSTAGRVRNYTQTFKFSSTALVTNEIALTTPYTITGKETKLLFGYSIMVPSANDTHYLIGDKKPTVMSAVIYMQRRTIIFFRENWIH